MKRCTLVPLLLVVALVTTCIPAMAAIPYNEIALPIVTDPITITVGGSTWVQSDWETTTQMKEISKKTGINFDFHLYTDDAWASQLTLMFASDTLTDCIFYAMANKAEMNDYGAQGYLLDMNQHLDVMPNLSALIADHPEYKAFHEFDGSMYSISCLRYDAVELVQMNTLINIEWLNNLSLEMPKTVDDLYNVLKAFKDNDANGNGDANDEIPFSTDTSSGQFVQCLIENAFGLPTNDVNNMLWEVSDDGEVYLGQCTDNYKAFLTYMNKLFSEGLMDNTAFLQTGAERTEKVKNNQVGLTSDWSGVGLSTTGLEPIDAWERYRFVEGLGSEYTNGIAVYPRYSVIRNFADFMISSKTEYPEEICKLFDYMITDEHNMLYNYGVEGETYEYTKIEGSNYELPTKFADLPNKVSVSQVMLTYSDYKNGLCEAASDDELMEMTKDAALISNAWRNLLARHANFVDPYPQISTIASENDVIMRYENDLRTYIQTMYVSFITGEVDIETGWQNFQDTMNAMGVEELVAAKQAAYDRAFNK